MLFNSTDFLFFFPVTVLVYFLLPYRFRWLHLLIASCVFYAAFIPAYIFILFFLIITDYIAALFIQKAEGRRRKFFLAISIISNVGFLSVFKYYNFFAENINALITHAGIAVNTLPYLHIILPVGLSFHTFQAMSYTIEVYRKNQQAEKHLGIYALYVMFFPQLVAGPVERPQNMLPQFRQRHAFSFQNLLDGLRLFCWGLFKKVVIADRLTVYTDAVFNSQLQYHYINLILAVVFFGIQIYCDFSGYSDMAIGSARVMGFRLTLNFNRPFFATSVQEFWRRWHISLTSWFRDYVYKPMGGNRGRPVKTYFNVLVVFLLSGLWHGANYTFIVWGVLHGTYVILQIFLQQNRVLQKNKGIAIKIAGFLITFLAVNFAWIFFRSTDLNHAFELVHDIVTGYNQVPFGFLVVNGNNEAFGLASLTIGLAMILYGIIIEKIYAPQFEELNQTVLKDVLFIIFTVVLIVCFGVFQKNSFIYFQF
jgi:alginate O-acetyltransferase complex protein AlgI